MNKLNELINWINRTGQQSGIGPIGVLILTVLAFGVGLLLLTFFSPVLIVILAVAAIVYFGFLRR